jgi:hypothetical protein
MNILDDEWTFKKKDEEDDVWGILADVDDSNDDWGWLNNTSIF